MNRNRQLRVTHELRDAIEALSAQAIARFAGGTTSARQQGVAEGMQLSIEFLVWLANEQEKAAK